MENPAAHPSREELSAYSLGQLPEERAVAIDSHISECGPCCETIVELSSEDTFAGLLQEAGRLPTDRTAHHESVTSKSSFNPDDIPPPVNEHPRYEVLELIGKGGMGDVYKARHRKMERTVALKVINRELVRKAEAIDRFHREVKAAAQLSHPNIVTSHDADQAGDYHFMVMEFVDGVDLSQIVKDRGALPVAEACDYVRQAAIGLQHAHKRGMVHRDIKPHNLMVTKDGTVKILDFGLASLAPESLSDADTVEASSDLTAAGAIMGTPDFISPEQAEDARQADIRSDIYSLGATLYFLLSGRVPFAEGSVMHKLKSHAIAEPEPLESLRHDLPTQIAAIVSRMTAKDPGDRFQTPAEVVEALEPLTKETQANESLEPVRQVQPSRRRSGWIPLTAIAMFFLASIFASIVYYIETNNGIVRVDVIDDSLAVEISGQTITVEDGNKQPVEIRAGDCVLKVRQGDFQFETKSFQIRRNEEIAFTVERLEGEVVVSKDGKRFGAKPLPSSEKTQKVLDRMMEAYAGCKSYRDSGVIKSVFFMNTTETESTAEHSFTTAFLRPDRFRFAIEDEDDAQVLISVDGQEVQTWWDVEPGIQKPESLDLAMTQAIGLSGADVGRIPAMLMPQELDAGVDLDLIDPKQIEDGKLQDVDCFRLEYNFQDEQITLWVDKQSYLVRRIDERILSDDIRIERTTTYDPTIDGKITDEMLEFDPPSLRAVDDRADLLPPDEELDLLQGDWETVSVTDGGKQLSAKESFGRLLLQIKGSTFALTETKLNGGISDPGTGLIEFDGTTNPKTIDFIHRNQPNKRSIGIYELKDGILRICMAEIGGNDRPAGERMAEVKPEKRPTTFDSPADGNILLMEFRPKQLDGNAEHEARNFLDTTYISNDTVGLLVAHPQRILSRKSAVKDELDQRLAKVAETEGLDVRNVNQIVVQLGPPPLSSKPIRNFFDERLWTVVVRFDRPVDAESYIEKHAQGYTKTKHKRETYYTHDSRMELWFPDNRTLILAVERRILSFIDNPEGTGPMASRMQRADATDDLLLEIDVRQAGPLLLESLPSETQAPEVYPVIEQTIEKLNRISLTVKQTADMPIRARFEAIDAVKANQLHALASVWFEKAKCGWPKLREMIRERPAETDTKLANALAEEIDAVLPATWLAIDKDQLLVRVENEGGVDLAALLFLFLLID